MANKFPYRPRATSIKKHELKRIRLIHDDMYLVPTRKENG